MPPTWQELIMATVSFDDLLDIRKGDDNLTLGAGPSHITKITTAAEWQTKAAALRDIFRQTLGQAPDLACPLDPQIVAAEECDGYLKRTVTYALTPQERTEAYVLIPHGLTTLAAAVLCIHPTTSLGKEQAIGNDPTEKGQNSAYALHLVQRGYITLAYDLLSANTRCYPGLKDFDTAPFYQQYPNWSVRGRDLWDVGRAIDLLQSLDEVDPNRIGSIGHSQGGGITIHAMALDERIAAGVSSCGDWPDRIAKNPFNGARTGWWVGRPALRPYCYTGKPFPIDLHEYLALAAPRPIMNIVALNDWMYGLDEEEFTRTTLDDLAKNVSSVYALLGAENKFAQPLHTAGHGFQQEQHNLAYTFLDQYLMPSN